MPGHSTTTLRTTPSATFAEAVSAADPATGLRRKLCEAPLPTPASGGRSVLIGDANAPGPIAWATYAGHRYARELDGKDIGDALPFRREVTELAVD
ncbi:hypothetical protein [Ruegeria sp. Alg231-54]|uniref:hypothetical protein n=1 Tax=Ruegeria sp. Alg231-54 TaxID=1922221 RepID=UPI00131EEDBF|nr:hypothetical protein [Ruegeria sp. Alg231-54]